MPKEEQKKEAVNKQPRTGGNTGNGFDKRPQDINKDGRPDTPWTWRELFMKLAEEKKGKLTRKEIAAKAQWEKMEQGDVKAFEKIVDRMEGKAKESVEHSGGVRVIVDHE